MFQHYQYTCMQRTTQMNSANAGTSLLWVPKNLPTTIIITSLSAINNTPTNYHHNPYSFISRINCYKSQGIAYIFILQDFIFLYRSCVCTMHRPSFPCRSLDLVFTSIFGTFELIVLLLIQRTKLLSFYG